MNYKSIFKTVGVVSVAAVFCVGCGGNDDDDGNGGGGGGGLVGDWEIVEEWWWDDYEGDSGIYQIPDYAKSFYSFTSSNDAKYTVFTKIDDFLVEDYDDEGKYSIKGNSVCFEARYNEENKEEFCMNYKISGNTLTLLYSGSYCYNYSCYSYSYRTTATKSNIATFKSSNKVYSVDPKIRGDWEMPGKSMPGTEVLRINDDFISFGAIYITHLIYGGWYAEGSVLTAMSLECAEFKGSGGDRECVSLSVRQSVQLDYKLSADGKTLSLRPAGSSTWDEWTLRNPNFRNFWW